MSGGRGDRIERWDPMSQQFDPEPLTLAEFLLARVSEDEARVYRADSDGEYRISWATIKSGAAFYTTVASDHANDEWVANGDHLVEKYGEDAVSVGDIIFDARRVLAECEAKRRLVKYAASWKGELTGRTDLDDGHGDAVLRALAQVYKDHPDFNGHDWLI